MVGTVRHIVNNKNQHFVQWTVNDKNHIKNVIIPLLQKYPPLTSQTYFQFEYLIKCIKNPTVDNYLITKNHKYDLQLQNFSSIDDYDNLPSYFIEWLGGFIEAEGSFCVRKNNKNYTFSIGQNFDEYLIKAICKFYSSNVKVQQKYIKYNYNKHKNIEPKYFYEISFASIKDLIKITNHCSYILQGYKYIQIINFIQNNTKLQDYMNKSGLKSVMLSCYYENKIELILGIDYAINFSSSHRN
uniref:Homing endonuclease LAGLIDADG domain-containing protein n=1 Tax=Malassezia yamatoensis TaxID=253288 RepID=A0A2I6QD12_9BASI|nr:hypothetical protein [Malassezia yamatoensis]